MLNSVYADNILNLMYKPFDGPRRVILFYKLKTFKFRLNPRSLAPVTTKYNDYQPNLANSSDKNPQTVQCITGTFWE